MVHAFATRLARADARARFQTAERWASPEAVEAPLAAAHVQAVCAAAGDLLAAVPSSTRPA